MKKAFTIVEIMIVVVTIGLLAAMAIPAFQKVRYISYVKELQSGRATPEQRKYIASYEKNNPKQIADSRQTVGPLTRREEPSVVIDSNTQASLAVQTIQVDGKLYILVPKTESRETEIMGKAYWLVKVKEP